MIGPGFRDALAKIVPPWLQNRPALNNGYKLLYSIALQLDCMVEAVVEGVYAAQPFINGRTDSLPFIGRTRGLPQGASETNTSYAMRLRDWLSIFTNAGWEQTLASQLQTIIGPVSGNLTTVTIITRRPSNMGFWTILGPTGTVTQGLHPWNWDGTSNPGRTAWWADMWIVVQPPPWPITGTTLAALNSVWGTNSNRGIGHAVPGPAADAIIQTIFALKSAHTWVRSVIWSYDSTWFQPGGANNPDGTWGNWGYPANANPYFPTRTQTARYWEVNSRVTAPPVG